MSRASGKQGQTSQRGGQTPPPSRGVRNISLLMLVGVVFVVAASMIISFASFIIHPDPAVKAGPMYVTFALTTTSALLMLAVAVNASYFPFITRRQAPNLYLMAGATGVTGVVTGILTVGDAATGLATRMLMSALALTFIVIQHSRLSRAAQAAPAAASARPAQTSRPAEPTKHTRSRQRRGGRKR